MKLSDIEQIQAAGLISTEQQVRIVEHFKLREESNKFLVIISWIGAVLIVAGIVLLISANWAAIPRLVKVVCALGLMLGAHGGGWWLREVRRDYPKAGEALHFVGAGLFLANVALLGQIYNLSSRLPNAIALWFVGITPLAWILRSKAQHVLSLLAFGTWFGMELDSPDGLFHYGWSGSELQVLLFALLGLCYLGAGGILRRTSFDEFAGPTEKLGLLAFNLGLYPLTWVWFSRHESEWTRKAMPLFAIMSVVALVLAALAQRADKRLTPQWRWTWLAALAGGVALSWAALWWGANMEDGWHWDPNATVPIRWPASIVLFIIALLQIQVGVQLRSAFYINLGVAMVAVLIITVYFDLFGSMATTGWMFLLSGIFLIAFGIYLEKKRRKLLRRMKEAAP
ncbi:MAG TPA: DUF2157 domain-containing protein [Verrucomicrobiae bacterium]|jgi:uncharacterized membrane protein